MRPHVARSRPWQAFASALGLEVGVLVAVMAWVETHPPTPIETVVPLLIETLVSPVPEKLPEPEKPKAMPLVQMPSPKPVTQVTPPPAPQPVPVTPIAPIAARLSEPVAAPVVAGPSSAFASPVPTVVAPVVPVVDPAPAYNAKLSAAVQAAFEVPATAAALGFKGRTRVEFSLRDGVVSAIRVVQGSGLGAADRAAIKAVQAAVYPPPPPALQGKEGSYQIWVACF
jgi:TonB family protein